MREFLQIIRPWDIAIVVFLIAISLSPIFIFKLSQANINDDAVTYVAIISKDNEVIRELPLTDNFEHEIFDLQFGNNEVNTIEVKNEAIRIAGATCSDQVCVRTGFISKPGETIICLPHKLLIEIKAIENSPPK